MTERRTHNHDMHKKADPGGHRQPHGRAVVLPKVRPRGGALTAAECKDYGDLARMVLEDVAHAQAGHQEEDKPADRFLALLRGALTAGKAHIAEISGHEPRRCPEAFGWRGHGRSGDAGDGGAAVRFGRTPLGDLVGWVEGEDLYLEPESAYRIVQVMARDQQLPLSTGRRMLQRSLYEAGKLKSTDRGKSRDTYTIRKTCGAVRNRPVLHLSSGLLTGMTGN